MKVVIIEGTDNVGKDTVINQLIQKYSTVKIIHCEKPKSKDPVEAASEQLKTFWGLAEENVHDNIHGKTDLIIHNRSWYGEYIYGVKYRANDPEKVKKMIHNLEDHLIRNGIDVCLITLLSSNVDFLVKNDDGLSISNKKNDIIEETNEDYKLYYNKYLTPEEIEVKERERLDTLTLTPADVERALYKEKQMDFDDLKALIAQQLPTVDIKGLAIEFRAKDFYRGAEANGIRLFDVVGQLLGYTSDDMDYLFEHKELPSVAESN